jgi:protein-tyrosine phosphatase
MFRSIEIPDTVNGEIYLHSMPGRYEQLHLAAEEINEKGISKVVSLAPDQEIEKKSPDFARAIQSGAFVTSRISFPIEDYGIPSDRKAFLELSDDLAKAVKNGESILIHCGAGIGRTGILATSVLMSLGIDPQTAIELVRAAGSGPETPDQEDLVNWVSTELEKRHFH